MGLSPFPGSGIPSWYEEPEVLTRESPSLQLAQTEALTDEQVVERVLSGDVVLFEILMRRNNTRVYRAIRSVLRGEAEVEDAMQAAYVHAYSKLRSFRGGARFSTWLTQIALNEALGRLRHGRRHPSVSLSVVEEPVMSPVVELDQSPEGHASRRELAAILERAVDSLPELYRVVFVLREIDGMDTAETASVLNVSEDVVKTRLSRARANLRKALEQLVGPAAAEAFGFHASRCDRVVANVMRQLASGDA
jgi:RNA polymerase sigma-70 factor, ECF subfamily